MKTRISNFYGWESPELMHKYSNIWDSKLNFILKEVGFLKDLLYQNVYPIMESKLLTEAETFIENLNDLKIEISALMQQMATHKNKVRILFNDSFQGEQIWEYKHEHRKLMIKMHEFNSKYQSLKKSVFRAVKEAIRHQKQGKLPDKLR